MSKNNLTHVAIIMDGNGRWAKKQNKERIYGHKEGIKVIPEIVDEAITHNIAHISFFAFSTENWQRSKKEIDFLLKLLNNFLIKKYLDKVIKKNIKLKWIGFEDNLDKKLISKLKKFENETINNNAIQVNFFFNYSGIKDLNEALKKYHLLNDNNLDIKKYLKTCDLPPVDLLIRTSGEKRISNFCLYDLAYSEIIFEQSYWPEYTKKIFNDNINEYNTRSRRFGKIENE